MKDLSSNGILVWDIGIASTIEAIVGHDHHLKHVVMECKRHLIERRDIFVQCEDSKHVGLISQICSQA